RVLRSQDGRLTGVEEAMRTEDDVATNVENVTAPDDTNVRSPAIDIAVPSARTSDGEGGEGGDDRTREIVFQFRDPEVKYSGHTAVREVNLKIAAKEITAFIGPSGCGKTTVLRCLNRMHDITPGAEVIGTVSFYGENLYASKVDAAEVRRRIGMVFQKP